MKTKHNPSSSPSLKRLLPASQTHTHTHSSGRLHRYSGQKRLTSALKGYHKPPLVKNTADPARFQKNTVFTPNFCSLKPNLKTQRLSLTLITENQHKTQITPHTRISEVTPVTQCLDGNSMTDIKMKKKTSSLRKQICPYNAVNNRLLENSKFGKTT